MVSISHVVEDIVKHRPYLSESLAAGIINVSSLARQLQPDVERALQKGVNTGAIVMALNRLAPYLQVREQVQLNKLLTQAYSPMTIRFFILQAHYRSTVDFSNEALQAAEKGLSV